MFNDFTYVSCHWKLVRKCVEKKIYLNISATFEQGINSFNLVLYVRSAIRLCSLFRGRHGNAMMASWMH